AICRLPLVIHNPVMPTASSPSITRRITTITAPRSPDLTGAAFRPILVAVVVVGFIASPFPSVARVDRRGEGAVAVLIRGPARGAVLGRGPEVSRNHGDELVGDQRAGHQGDADGVGAATAGGGDVGSGVEEPLVG